MKKISDEHFDRMKMMSNCFLTKSENDEVYLKKYKVAKAINEMIEFISLPLQSDFDKIFIMISKIDEKNLYHGGIQWYDYKIHLNAIAIENGYKLNIL